MPQVLSQQGGARSGPVDVGEQRAADRGSPPADELGDAVRNILRGDTAAADKAAADKAADKAAADKTVADKAVADKAAADKAAAGASAQDFAGVPSEILDPKGAEDVDEGEPPEIKDSPKAKNSWQKIKQEKKELQAKLEAAQRDLEAAKGAKPPEMEQFIAMQRKLQEAEDRIGKLDITQSAAFKQKYDAPLDLCKRKAMGVLLRFGVEKEAAETLAKQVLDPKLDARALEQLVADQPIAVQGALFTVATEYQQAVEARDAAITDWKNEKAALQANETIEKDVKLAQNVEAETQSATQKALEAGNWLYAEVPGNKAWNDAVNERVKAVKAIMRGSSREDIARWVVEGVTAKQTRDLFLRARSEFNELKKQFEAVVGRAPRLGGGAAPDKPGSRPAARPSVPQGRSPEEVWDSLVNPA